MGTSPWRRKAPLLTIALILFPIWIAARRAALPPAGNAEGEEALFGIDVSRGGDVAEDAGEFAAEIGAEDGVALRGVGGA